MKLTFLLLFAFQVGAWATGFAQENRVSLQMKDVSLEKIILELREQTGIRFFYSIDKIKRVEDLSIDAKDEVLKDVLSRLLKGTGLTYILLDEVIVIKDLSVALDTDPVTKAITLKGRVTDEKKQALPGVTVKLSGTSAGTATDTKGWFSLQLPVTEGKLEFSFVGFTTRIVEFTRKTAGDTIRVILKEELVEMEEVIVTGYQVIKEKAMAGAYAKVKAKDLVMTGNETVEQMLQGRLPGVMITNTSGLTGTRQKVRVRGTSTLVGNAEPVWAVDGIIQEDNIPFEASTLATIGDGNLDMMKDFIGGAISWLNPNDIEDITVLKDASATAIYGVKAANGVILITTKRGERGAMSLNYSGSFSTSVPLNYDRMEIMNSRDRVELSREAFKRGARVKDEKVGYTGLALAYSHREISLEQFQSEAKKLETVNTDWFDILYQVPFSQNHSVSFSGGAEDATYRASFGYTDNQNTAKGNSQTSYTASMNMDVIFWKKLTLMTSLSGTHAETKAFADKVDPYDYAIKTSRVIGCYNKDGSLYSYDNGGYNYNILNELNNSGNENVSKSLHVNVNARWRFSEALALSATLGTGTGSNFAESWFTEKSHKITGLRGYEYGKYGVLDATFKQSPLPYGGMQTVSESRNLNYTARLQLEYVSILDGVHALNFVAGAETRHNKYDGYSQTNWGYMPDRGKKLANVPLYYGVYDDTPNSDYARTVPTITDQLSNTMSYYATCSYMYDDRYAINFSIRGDASNRFGSNVKFQPVWSAGVRWNVTDEHWMEAQNLVNNLAFSGSFGYQGNVVENVGPDLIAKMAQIDADTGEWQMTWSQLPNPDLKWEKTLSVNLNVDFSFFNSKLNGCFNWYYKKTTDVITKAEVPYETGTSSMYINDGSMSNRGWDLALNVVPVRTKDFVWSFGTTFSGNENKVNSQIRQSGSWEQAIDGSLNKKGYPVGSFWAFQFTGLDPNNGGPLFDLSRANTSKASEDATEYMVHMGTIEPTFTVGINMVFRWKRFSFPLNFYISRGNYKFLSSPYESGHSMLSEYKNASSQLNERWREPGDEKHTNIPSIPAGDNCLPLYPFEDGTTSIYPLDAWAHSDVRVVNAWYIRFNDLQFSYNLPEKWIKGFAENVSVSFTATNPLQIKSKDFKGRDPEVAMGKQPRSQNLSMGINVSF